jgi:hypothetical protein
MKQVAVSSSNIRSVGYDKPRQVMVVTFHNGTTYEYANVSAEAHAALMSAGSVGGYFAANIRGKYPTKKVSSDD